MKPLVEALEAEGFSVWWDQHISGGANWREEIEAHLDAAKVVIVVWSKRSIGPEGRFVRDEAGAAQESGHYLPITVDNVRPPLGFREVQAIDLSNWWGKRSDPRFQTLCDTVRSRLEGGTIAAQASAVRGPLVSRRAAIAGGAGVAVLSAAGGGYLLLGGSPAEARRIAVLPFSNLSTSSGDYFAAGLSEELRSALSRAGLQVIGRNSSEAVAKEDSATIARKLKVSHILTGSVRSSPETLRVSVQLVETGDDVESWAQNYDRAPGDSIKIQSDIAEHVASALSVAMGVIKKAVELGGTNDPEAQAYVLQGREVLKIQGTTKDSLKAAIDLNAKAVARDPDFARAWIAMGLRKSAFAALFAASTEEATAMLAGAERDIRQGLTKAPSLADGHSGLGALASQRLDFALALASHRRAIALAPNDATVLGNALNDLPYFGSLAEAQAAAQMLVSVDPLSANAHLQSATVFDVSGRVEKAMEAAEKALALSGTNVNVIHGLALYSVERGDYEKALRAAADLPAEDFRAAQIGAVVAARQGRRPDMDKHVGSLRDLYGDYASYQYAQIHAQAGNLDQAFAALDVAVKVQDPGLIETMRDPLLKPLRKDPRLLAILKRLRFPIIDPGIGPA